MCYGFNKIFEGWVWMNCLPWHKFFPSCQTACFLLSVREQCVSLERGFEWHLLRVRTSVCVCVCACMHKDPLYACLHATRQSVLSTNMSTMSYSMFGLELGQLLIVWCVFSSSSPLPFSCPHFDYNQVFFLILQWAKEQRTVRRASQWVASCWTVSNTWGSDQLVSPSASFSSSVFPPPCLLYHTRVTKELNDTDPTVCSMKCSNLSMEKVSQVSRINLTLVCTSTTITLVFKSPPRLPCLCFF